MVDHKCKLSHGKVNKEIVWRNNPYIANLFNVHNFGNKKVVSHRVLEKHLEQCFKLPNKSCKPL